MKLTDENMDYQDCRPPSESTIKAVPEHLRELVGEETGVEARTGINVRVALRNVLMILQQEPRNYRYFGIYWWLVKALLKRQGYTETDLYLLGDFVDPITAAMVPKAGLQDTLRAAFEEYGQNATYPRSDGMVENADGELVVVHDQDAGL